MQNSAWYLYTKRGDFEKIAAEYNISPILAKLIVNRDVQVSHIADYLRNDSLDMELAYKFKDVTEASKLLALYIKDSKKIRVVGDYDIDGICATYILTTALKALSANVDFDIPDRIKDGYGINESIVDRALKDGCELILTCDNGIAAFDAIRYAKEEGLKVIISDHHEVFREGDKDLLPVADFIVNPRQSDCGYPFKSVCGAFVAYRLMQVLYKEMGADISVLENLIEFVAIATVGDVMPLISENRAVVKQGLRAMEHTANKGLKALISVCELDAGDISAYHIGFILGPCFNASGRLESAKLALKLLMEEDEDKCRELALYIKELNDERKSLTLEGFNKAIELVEAKYKKDDIMVVYLPDCHESLAGIIAGRLKERYKKPCFVITDTEEGLIKGSGRSIEAYNMFEGIREADELLTKYGGHPMAAGLSMKPENLDSFRTLLNSNSKLMPDDFIEKIWIDIALPFAYISEDLVKELELLEPFGQGNQKPSFAQKQVEILSLRVFGANRNVVKLSLRDSAGSLMEAVIFTDGDEFLAELGTDKFIDIIYYPKLNEYNNRKNLQIIIREWKFRR